MGRSLKEIRADIIKDLTIPHTEIRGYSPLEKFQFVQRAMDNCRDYCCAKWGMNPESVPTSFRHGMSFSTLAVTRVPPSREFGVVQMNPAYSLSMQNPLKIYFTAMHEMRHINQFLLQHPSSRESKTYYNSLAPVNSKMSAVQWSASPAEKAADKFGYGTIFALYTKGILKGEAKMMPIEMKRLISQAIKDKYGHIKGSILYPIMQVKSTVQNVFSRGGNKGVESNIGAKTPTQAERQAYVSRQMTLTLKEIEFLAQIYPQEFGLKDPNLSDKDRVASIQAIHNIFEEYRTSQQLAMQRFSSEKTTGKDLGTVTNNAIKDSQQGQTSQGQVGGQNNSVSGVAVNSDDKGVEFDVSGTIQTGSTNSSQQTNVSENSTGVVVENSTLVATENGSNTNTTGVVESSSTVHSSTFASIMEHIISTHSNSQGGAQTEVVKDSTSTQVAGSLATVATDNSQSAGGSAVAEIGASSGGASALETASADMGAGLDMGGQE